MHAWSNFALKRTAQGAESLCGMKSGAHHFATLTGANVPRRSDLAEERFTPPVVDVSVGMLRVAHEGTLISQAIAAGLVVCVYDPVQHMGGLIHALLPTAATNGVGLLHERGTFVDTGIQALVAEARAAASTHHQLRAWLVGAAEAASIPPAYRIGRRNVVCARSVLESEDVVVEAECVGGHGTRTVVMQAATGNVYVKRTGREGRLL